jgi:hypothetical protein
MSTIPSAGRGDHPHRGRAACAGLLRLRDRPGVLRCHRGALGAVQRKGGGAGRHGLRGVRRPLARTVGQYLGRRPWRRVVGDHRTKPVRVLRSASLPLRDVTDIATAPYHACARTETGAIWCWGAYGFGQLGRGFASEWERPGRVPDLAKAAAIGAGFGHSCAVLAAGPSSAGGPTMPVSSATVPPANRTRRRYRYDG